MRWRLTHAEGSLAGASLDARGRVDVAEFEDLIRRSGGAMIEGAVDVIHRREFAAAEDPAAAHSRPAQGGAGRQLLEVLLQLGGDARRL